MLHFLVIRLEEHFIERALIQGRWTFLTLMHETKCPPDLG